MKSIVLLSGGMDSAVCAAIAAENSDELIFLHFLYGQKTEKKEIECFFNLAKYYSAEQTYTIPIPFFKEFTTSSLTDNSIPVPENQLNNVSIPNTYVPYRNGIFISYAVAVAETRKYDKIFIGAVEEDSSGYPDCRQAFYQNLNNAVREGTVNNNITIETPLIQLSKKEIVLLGNQFKVPFHLTWSCYQNAHTACGVCDSCLLRLKAFREAGLNDPISYQKI